MSWGSGGTDFVLKMAQVSLPLFSCDGHPAMFWIRRFPRRTLSSLAAHQHSLARHPAPRAISDYRAINHSSDSANTGLYRRHLVGH